MSEIWKAIPNYEGLYEASSSGRVRSIDRIVTQYSAKAGKPVPLRRSGKVLCQDLQVTGYFSLTLSKDGVRRTHRVNIVVCKAFHGNPPIGHVCRHLNGIRSDNSASNLCWGTHKENQADRHIHGTHLCGESVATAKFSADQISKMRGMHFHLAYREFGISRTHFYRVRKGESWAHL